MQDDAVVEPDDRRLIVVAGESLVDRVVRPDGTAEERPGGGPFNTARALGRLGTRVAFLGGLSTDAWGGVLRGALLDDGVDLSLAPVNDRPTLIAEAVVDGAGNATYTFEPAGSAAASLTEAVLPRATAAVHVGTLGLVLEPTATAITRLAISAAPDAILMVDPNIRPAAIGDEGPYRARLDAVLGRADVVKVSVDDLRWLAGSASTDEALERLLAGHRPVALITDGPRPVRVITPDRSWTVPVPRVEVVDTIGAGDAFGAGFLHAWVSAGGSRGQLIDHDAVDSAVRFAVEFATSTLLDATIDPRNPRARGTFATR